MERPSDLHVRGTRVFRLWAVAALPLALVSTLATSQTSPDQWPADEFIAKVQAAVDTAQQQNDKSLAALEDMFPRGGVYIKRAADAANYQLRQLRAEVDARECPAHARQSGVPADLLNALYLMEWANPLHLAFMPCNAARRGAKFRFNVRGLLSKDSFEITGKRAVQVTLVRETLPDGQTIVFVPVKAKVNGDSFAVTRANLQSLALQIRMAVNSE